MIWSAEGLTLVLQDRTFLIPQEALLIAALAGAALLFLGFLRLQFARRGPDGACRWRRAPAHRQRLPFRKWRCRACGVDAYSTDRQPPKECKKGLKTGL